MGCFYISFNIYAATVFQQKVPPYTKVCLLGQSQPVIFWVRVFQQYPLEYHYKIQQLSWDHEEKNQWKPQLYQIVQMRYQQLSISGK